MKYGTASFYQEFRCIGGICEDSCCENWEIDLDDASLKKYMKQPGAFGKRLKENTRVRERQFILNGTRCPFLNADNLCDIYIEMGEDCLCETCTNFPRHVEEFDDLKEVSLTMSCPEASRMMLARKEKMTFEYKEGTDMEYGLKQSVPVRTFAFWRRNSVNKLDRPLFEVLWKVRPFLFSILQNRNWPIAKRAATVLLFTYEMQDLIDKRQYGEILHRLERKWNSDKRNALEKTFEKYSNRTMEKEVWMKQILNMYEGLETIKEEWKVLLSDGMRIMHSGEDMHTALIAAGLVSAQQSDEEQSSFLRNYAVSYQEFWDYYQRQEYEFEHILVYYMFQYFLGAAYDGDAFTKVKFAVVSYLVILELDLSVWLKQHKEFLYEDQVLVAHAYSKEVEHSYTNFESLQLVLSAHPILEVEQILIALLS